MQSLLNNLDCSFMVYEVAPITFFICQYVADNLYLFSIVLSLLRILSFHNFLLIILATIYVLII